MRCAALALLGVVSAGNIACGQPYEGRLKTIQESATVKIAYRTDSRPFSFVGPGGRPLGYSIELCERIAKHLETELRLPKLDIKWVLVDTPTRFEAIINGAADMECGSTTVSLSRLKMVDFSSLIYAESTGVLIKNGSGIFRFDNMAGKKKIGVIAGSTNARAIREQLQRRNITATLVEFRDREEGVGRARQGELDGFATDKLVLLALAQAANLRDYALLPDDLSFEPFAIMLPRNDWAFRLAVNTGLARVFRSGEVVELYTKFFSSFARQPSSWIGAIFTFGGLPE